jgi:hypothetical protein
MNKLHKKLRFSATTIHRLTNNLSNEQLAAIAGGASTNPAPLSMIPAPGATTMTRPTMTPPPTIECPSLGPYQC